MNPHADWVGPGFEAKTIENIEKLMKRNTYINLMVIFIYFNTIFNLS
jgi:hypothetical protein